MNEIICQKCEQKTVDAQFCINCGTSLKGWKSRIKGIEKKVRFQTRSWTDNMKKSMNQQINSYLNTLNSGKELVISGVTIPQNRRGSVEKALLKFQNKIGEDEEFNEWLEELPKRLENNKCVVCYAPWQKTDSILVCKYCEAGGHQKHMKDWVSTNPQCPLCRETLQPIELLRVTFE